MPWLDVRPGRSAVPVLCYHSLGGNGMAPALFAAQMRWLRERGVRSLRLDELRRYLSGDLALSGPAACITFDDGFRDILTRAAPVLAENGLNAVAFMIASRIRPEEEPGLDGDIHSDAAHKAYVLHGERAAWLSAGEMRGLAKQGVVEFGSHGMRHLKLPFTGPELIEVPDHWAFAPWQERGAGPAPKLAPELSRPLMLAEGRLESDAAFEARVQEELSQSRAELEAACGAPVTALAWPWGAYRAESVEAARRAGFDLCFTTKRGSATPGVDAMRLPRLEVRSRRTLSWFTSRMAVYSRAWAAKIYNGMRI